MRSNPDLLTPQVSRKLLLDCFVGLWPPRNDGYHLRDWLASAQTKVRQNV